MVVVAVDNVVPAQSLVPHYILHSLAFIASFTVSAQCDYNPSSNEGERDV